MYVGTLEVYNQTAMESILCPRQLTQAEKEASLFIYEHMKSENTSVCYSMYMVLMIVKLAENSSISLFFLVGITTKELFPI